MVIITNIRSESLLNKIPEIMKRRTEINQTCKTWPFFEIRIIFNFQNSWAIAKCYQILVVYVDETEDVVSKSIGVL